MRIAYARREEMEEISSSSWRGELNGRYSRVFLEER